MPSVLALDDNPELLALRSLVLAAKGLTVYQFADPAEALVRLSSGGIDVIVTDYEMPGMDGVSFAKHARSAGFIGGIVLSTGAAFVEAAQALWIDRVVKKGEPIHALLEAINYCLKGNHERPQT
jgi:CheY-like chemotaxis protein